MVDFSQTPWARVPSIDFSIIGDLPKTYEAARLQQARKDELAKLGQGASADDVATGLFKAGDIEGGLSLAKLSDAKATRDYARKSDERDFNFRVDEAQQRQRNNDRSYEKPRQFSVGDVTKLTEEGGKFGNLNTFATTFEPRFAGYKSQTLGNLAMTAGRYAPSITPKDTADAAKFWQGYDRYKNTVRNDLFGSALTRPELEAFEKADINPGMDPEVIKTNLAAQQKLVSDGLKKKANALISAGYDPAVISQAYGVDLKELGVTAQPRGGQQPPAGMPQGAKQAPDGKFYLPTRTVPANI